MKFGGGGPLGGMPRPPGGPIKGPGYPGGPEPNKLFPGGPWGLGGCCPCIMLGLAPSVDKEQNYVLLVVLFQCI